MNIKRALISVSDKTGIVELARCLSQHNIELISTGNTAKQLREANIAVTEVSDYTGFPEIMGGRVKTLHPKIHGGILGRREQDHDIMEQHDIGPIDMVIVNLYPFQQVTSQPSCDLATAIENIDIGGPCMLRAAAKNFSAVTVVNDPQDYAAIIEELTQTGSISLSTRQQLAYKAFTHCADYDAHISQYLAPKDSLPNNIIVSLKKVNDLRYGENPQQLAALYQGNKASPNYQQHQGKALSYNNLVDADSAYQTVTQFASDEQAACVIVKHANPCGVALAATPTLAYQRALATDKTSAFGGIIAFNHTVDEVLAQTILDNQYTEVIIAPQFSDSALACLAQKPLIRLLQAPMVSAQHSIEFKCITQGVLVQELDHTMIAADDLTIVSQNQAPENMLNDLLFAWKVVKQVKSNAIIYVRDQATLGIGAGQMSRIDSTRFAAQKAQDANLSLQDAIMASDAALPFADNVDHAASLGIKAIIQPGGSKRDAEVIARADHHNIIMVMTKIRHFRH